MSTSGTDRGNCVSSACLTLEYAVSKMAGGDTLAIADGIYSGTENCLDEFHMPPSGSSNNRTVIRAVNAGGAIFPDSFLFMTGPASVSFVDIIGLKATSGTTLSYNTSNWRFFRCAFTHSSTLKSDASTLAIAGKYHLVEDCWAWGEGRYGMYANASDYTNHIVFRRCVVRMDKLNAYSPIAAMHAYGVDQVAFQNCIVLDGNHNFWLDYEENGPAFYTHNGAEETIVDGCIVINYPSYFSGGTPGAHFKIKNSTGIDLLNGLIIDMKKASPDNFSVDHLTIWNTDSIGIQAKNIVSVIGPVTNSIVYNNSIYGVNGWGLSSDYNVLYANGADYLNPAAGNNDYSAVNSNAIDPSDGTPGNGTACVRYPTRVEAGSDCDGTGFFSCDRGATILKRIGNTGTVWGEDGWNIVTEDDLWPWAYEDRIKTDMASYTYSGVDREGNTGQTLSGARGFAAGMSMDGSDQTLTKYIWEYFGNQVPSDFNNDSYRAPEPQTHNVQSNDNGCFIDSLNG